MNNFYQSFPSNQTKKDSFIYSLLKKAFKPKEKELPGDDVQNDILDDIQVDRQDTTSSMPTLSQRNNTNKDFWMRDEQVKECYDCKQPFNYFRRKHHCRVCGQIFCHACASNIVNDENNGDLRVCDFCFHLMANSDRDSNVSGHRRESSSDGLRRLFESALASPIIQNFSTPSFDTLITSETGFNPQHQRRNSFASGYNSFDRKFVSHERRAGSITYDKKNVLSLDRERNRLKKKKQVPFRTSLDDDSFSPNGFINYSNENFENNRNDEYIDRYNEIKEEFQSGELTSYLNIHPETVSEPMSRDYKQSPSDRRKQNFRKFSSRNYSRFGLAGGHFKSGSSAQTSNSSLPSLQPPDLKPAQNVQLNQASVNHITQLMHQMLVGSNISQIGTWKKVIMEMLLSIVQKLDPNIRKGDEIDIRNYVKIKKIPGGTVTESNYVDGVVASKKVLHKKMLEPVENCKILLLTFPLEYQRVENQYVSLEPIMAQEREHLKNLVGRIIALKPDVVMVEKTVARVALEYLLEANIIVIPSVKHSLLSAVSRCTKADIVHSIDKLSQQVLGHCDKFSVKIFINHLIPRYRKTFLYVQGCPEDLGCTLVLRGGTLPELTKVKEIVDFLVFATYSLKLETCLLQDEYAMTPTIEAVELPDNEVTQDGSLGEKGSAIKLYENTILSGSPNVHFPIPFLLQHYGDTEKIHSSSQSVKSERHEATTLAIESQIPLLLNAERLSPIAHQSIVVLYSNHSASSIVPCVSPQPHLIEYYGDSDLTLGQFIEDSCFGSDIVCGAKECEKPAFMHYRSYSHGEGKVTVTVASLPCPVSGMENQILIWSLCKICSFSTPFIPMSEETWKYSFGKYLELTFYHKGLNCRANTCPHDIHRNFMRYFSFRNLTVRFEYESIGLYEICGPPMRRKPKPETIVKLRQQDMEVMKGQITDYYDSVIERIQKFTYEIVAPEKQIPCQECMMNLSKKALSEKKFLLQLLHQTFIASSPSDSLALNTVYKSLCQNVVVWEKEFSAVIRNYLQTDVREIRRVTAVKIKRIFAEKEILPLDTRNTFFQSSDLTKAESDFERLIPIESSKLPKLDYQFADNSLAESFTDPIQRHLMMSLYRTNDAGLPIIGSSPVEKHLQINDSATFSLKDGEIPLQTLSFSNSDLLLCGTQHSVEESNHEVKTTDPQLVLAKRKTLRFDPTVYASPSSQTQPDRNFAEEDFSEWNTISGVSGGVEKDSIHHDAATSEARPTSLMQTITNLWNGNPGNFLPLDYPSNPSEHMFPDSSIIVREDEPSSLVAFALSSAHYIAKLQGMRLGGTEKVTDLSTTTPTVEKEQVNFTIDFDDNPADIEETLLRDTGTHIRYQYWDGPTKMHCKIYFAEQFDALRRNCGISDIFEQSLARCIKWDATGGKSGTFFMKTKDDWLVIKKLSPVELEALVSFSPAYFEYMSHAFFHDLPTVLAKIFGFYHIGFKNPINKKTVKMDILVMENLFYERPNVTRIFDLKGSVRNRHVQSTGKLNEVLLDKNLMEFILESPLFIREHSKKVLRASVYNDTLFLSKLNVMDYSLLVGIDQESNELVIGIVGKILHLTSDFIRTFTWDKKLESWVKETGLLGGGKEPTIVTPRQYKNRFREAMEKYFLMVPDKFLISGSNSKELSQEE